MSLRVSLQRKNRPKMAGEREKGKLKIYSINCQKSIDAHHELAAIASSGRCIVLMQEPQGGKKKIPFMGNDVRIYHAPLPVRAAIAYDKNLNLTPLPFLSRGDITTVHLKSNNLNTVCASVYAEVTENLDQTFAAIDKIIAYCKKQKAELIIGSDSNSHSVLWGYISSNRRGEKWEYFIAQNGLQVLNDSDTLVPTWAARGTSSAVDIMVCTAGISSKIKEKLQIVDFPESDHQLLKVEIETDFEVRKIRPLSKCDWGKYKANLEKKKWTPPQKWDQLTIEEESVRFMDCIHKAYEYATPQVTIKGEKKEKNKHSGTTTSKKGKHW